VAASFLHLVVFGCHFNVLNVVGLQKGLVHLRFLTSYN
jgi:hypothetical protein